MDMIDSWSAGLEIVFASNVMPQVAGKYMPENAVLLVLVLEFTGQPIIVHNR